MQARDKTWQGAAAAARTDREARALPVVARARGGLLVRGVDDGDGVGPHVRYINA